MPLLEAPCNSVEMARAAYAAGVDRIEIFQPATAESGATPPLSRVEELAELGGSACEIVPVVKPVDGPNFLYSAEQKQAILRDCRMFVRAGCSGVVVGGWVKTGGVAVVDADFMSDVVETVAPLPVSSPRNHRCEKV